MATANAKLDRSESSTATTNSDSTAGEVAPNWSIKDPEPINLSLDSKAHLDSRFSGSSEMEMIKLRFVKLLLGEDISGGGKGVCSTLVISNAISNLCATIFGQLWRLEPLPPEKKLMWKREMELLLCVGDHIVELFFLSHCGANALLANFC